MLSTVIIILKYLEEINEAQAIPEYQKVVLIFVAAFVWCVLK
jgi:hypothetical protein